MRLSARTGPFRWRFSARYARICTRWPCRRNLWKNASETSNIKSASWVICVPALCRSSTTSAAIPIAAAKPTHPSNMALITKSVLPGTARAPASLSVRKTSTRLNSNWKTIANSANSSTSGSPCRRSCPACAFVRSAEPRMMKSNAVNHEFPSKRVTWTANSKPTNVPRTPANKGPHGFRDRN